MKTELFNWKNDYTRIQISEYNVFPDSIIVYQMGDGVYGSGIETTKVTHTVTFPNYYQSQETDHLWNGKGFGDFLNKLRENDEITYLKFIGDLYVTYLEFQSKQ